MEQHRQSREQQGMCQESHGLERLCVGLCGTGMGNGAFLGFSFIARTMEITEYLQNGLCED